MRVLVANYRFFIAGGPERYLFQFMEAAKRRGIEVIPFSVQNPLNEPCEYAGYFAKPRADALMYSDTRYSFRNIYGMFRAVVWNFDAARKIRKLIRDTRPDALYLLHEINHLSPSIIRAARKEGVRVVHRISDYFMFCARYDYLCGEEICEACRDGHYGKALRMRCVKDSFSATALRLLAMKLHLLSRVYQDVDLFITPAAFTRKKLARAGIPEEKLVHVPTFTRLDKKPSYGHEKYFLFLGRIARQKGTIYAVKAMRELRGSGYVLKITGTLSDTPEDRELKDYIAEQQLENVVIFTGFLKGSDLDLLIEKAVCVVCPSIWYENMPNAVLEAYAHGKPVVASRIGSLEEMVEEGATGFLFPPKDSHALAGKLRRFVEDEDLSARMGKRAREKCEAEYGEDLHMEKVISCLRGKSVQAGDKIIGGKNE